MQKLTSLAAMAVASTVLLAACGDGDTGGGSGGDVDEVVIGAVHPLTGALAGAGTMMSQAAEMAVADINEAGGIECLDGAELRLETGDSEGVAATGQSEAQRLIDEGAAALVGTYQSDVTQNVSSVAERGGVPLVIDVAVDDAILEQGYKNTFRVQPNATSMGTDGGEALLAMAEESGESIDSVSYIHVEGAFGQSVYDAFAATAEENGIEVNEITYSADQLQRRHARSSARPPPATPTSSWPPATTPTACSSPRPSSSSGPTSRVCTASPTAPSTTAPSPTTRVAPVKRS